MKISNGTKNYSSIFLSYENVAKTIKSNYCNLNLKISKPVHREHLLLTSKLTSVKVSQLNEDVEKKNIGMEQEKIQVTYLKYSKMYSPE